MIKGCLGKITAIFAAVFIIVAIITGVLYGGYLYIKRDMQAQLYIKDEELSDRAEKYIDISDIPEEYKLTKVLDVTGVMVVIAEYIPNGQKMGIISPGWVAKFKEQDVLNGSLEKKINNYLAKIENEKLQVNIKNIEQKHSFNALNQTVPYLESDFSVLSKGRLTGRYRGIIAVVKNSATDKNNLVISYNETGKYEPAIADKFFKNVKFHE